MANQRQTLSFLQRRFAEVGLWPDARRGQNFLVDLNLLDLLIRAGEVETSDVVLEVGTGTGALTSRLAQLAGAVISVEIDARLHQLASEELQGAQNVQLVRKDVLRNKNNIDGHIIELIQAELAARPGAAFKLIANLPFQIATPLLSNFLLSPVVPAVMAVTIQKELADRIMAAPRTKDYGALSVWVQSLCDVQLVRILPPSVFWPRPKVHSAILRIQSRDDKRAQIEQLAEFHQFARAMFFHRRKFLRSVMISAYKGQLDKSQVDHVMERMKLGQDSRAEQLSVSSMLEMFRVVTEVLDSGDRVSPTPQIGQRQT